MDCERILHVTTPPPASAAPPPHKRSGQSEFEGHTRSKRRRYAAVACNECKKRKLKCIGGGEGVNCERCVAGRVPCIFNPDGSHVTRDKDKDKKIDGSKYQKLTDETYVLRQQLTALSRTVNELTRSVQPNSLFPTEQQNANPVYAPATSRQTGEPQEPYFVGHTNPAFSFRIARTSLSEMGIATDLPQPPSDPESLAASPRVSGSEQESWVTETCVETDDCLLNFSVEEVIRLIEVFQEEVESMYPLISSAELAANARSIMKFARDASRAVAFDGMNPPRAKIGLRDVQMLKIAISTAIVIEARCKNDLSTKMVDSVEERVCRVSGYPILGLKELQLWTMLSIYYFHCDEEMLAWRTIGIAARMALEQGLHRKESLMDNFKEVKARDLAVRTFWCVYVLDRRCSFGTSLSFALVDRDIDPELPQPGEDFQNLRCLVAYGRLSSKVWDALPPFGSPQQFIPEDKVAFLNFVTQNWVGSIPTNLQLRHPRLGLAPWTQPRALHRLRALLYLHGNHMRTLIHRHHVLSSANIMADVASARLVVDIAKDTIQVLVHLNNTTDIYARQQSAFNYFLISALAVILLAVCHAPAVFATTCRESFVAAVDLVKGFSLRSFASRRLWKCIKGLLPGINSLGMQSSSDAQQNVLAVSHLPAATRIEAAVIQGGNQGNQDGWEKDRRPPEMNTIPEFNDMWMEQATNPSPGATTSVPDAYQISNDLIGLFDAFGQATSTQPLSPNLPASFFGLREQGIPVGDIGEISWRFQDLI
ncbi:hypothetical protein B0O99DRAFT_400740 [Bisporella sp. PMI_857]|nr:hypothetical protein B0O99DRAFT_400740 [Bisporella sp. PMI_857]